MNKNVRTTILSTLLCILMVYIANVTSKTKEVQISTKTAVKNVPITEVENNKNPTTYDIGSAACFAPDADPNKVEAFYTYKSSIQNSLGIPTTGDSKFNITSRWAATAIDGGGLGQGDITTLTWSYVPDGAPIGNGGCGVPDQGTFTSDFITFFNGIYGPPTVSGDYTTAPWHNLFVEMFATWSQASGLIFVYEPNDDGSTVVTSDGILGVRGDLRISGHRLDGNSNVLACNYFPNSGDMIIDTADSFYTNNPGNATLNLLAHEVGHGLGILHVCPLNQTKLMEPFVTAAFAGPQEDAILAVNRHYGDAEGVNDSPDAATLLGSNPLPTSYSKLQRSIDDDSDIDYFSLTTNGAALLSGELTPTGSTYLEGIQNSNGSCSSGTPFNSLELADIQMEVLDQDGFTVLATASENPVGVPETLSNIPLPSAGTYYVRVQQQGEAINNVQMYNLTLTLQVASDDLPPLAICTDLTATLDDTGNVSITAQDVDGGSSDSEGAVMLSISSETFNCENLGENAVTLTATDSAGQTATCVATVTIVDEISPVLTCPANITVNSDEGSCGAIITYELPTFTDNCSGVAIEQTAGIQSGSLFTDGTTTNTFVVTDAGGNTDTCSFTVTVMDNEPPVSICQNITIALDDNGTATITSADVDNGSTDACGIESLEVSTTTFQCSDLGDNTITLSVTDVNGNITTCSAVVTVVDSMAPEILCPTEEIVIDLVSGNTSYEVPDFFDLGTIIATDNCIIPVADITQDPVPGTLLEEGLYDIITTATDSSGNTETCTFQLLINAETLGIPNTNSLENITLYPNPTSNDVYLNNPQSLVLEQISVYDMMGRRVLSQDISNWTPQNAIDLSQLQRASYIFIIQSKEGQLVRQIIKE